MLFLFSVTLVLAYFLQKSLTAPIINLANVMDWVTHNDDYSVRVEKSVDDEIGTLYTDFNAMLERIETSI